MVDRIPDDVGGRPVTGNGRARTRRRRLARRMSFSARPPASRWRRRILWLALGLALGALVGLFYKMRRPSEALTLENLQQARQRWEQVGPTAYTMDIQIRGAQHGNHHVEVRDGAVRMTTDGAPVNQEAAERWTVDGLFVFLETELGNVKPDRAKELYNVDDPSRIMLRVHYDPRFSYPAYFHRHVPGSVMDIEWIVRKFEVSE
jgi:hypothetical protein